MDHHLNQYGHWRGPAAPLRVVGRDPLAACGGTTPPNRIDQIGGRHVQERLVQSGVGGVGQILGRAGRTHREAVAGKGFDGADE